MRKQKSKNWETTVRNLSIARITWFPGQQNNLFLSLSFCQVIQFTAWIAKNINIIVLNYNYTIWQHFNQHYSKYYPKSGQHIKSILVTKGNWESKYTSKKILLLYIKKTINRIFKHKNNENAIEQSLIIIRFTLRHEIKTTPNYENSHNVAQKTNSHVFSITRKLQNTSKNSSTKIWPLKKLKNKYKLITA